MKLRHISLSLAALLAAVTKVDCLGQNQTVSFSPGNGLQIAGSGMNGQILVSANDWWGVLRAAEDLAGDLRKVVGTNLTLGNWMSSGSEKRDVLEHSAEEVRRYKEVRDAPTGSNSGESHWGSRGWENGGKRNPPSPGQNVNSTSSSGTTVYYEFQPVTNFVNYTLGPTQNFTGPTLINNSKAQTVIIAGTIGKSDIITQLISSKKLDVSEIEGQWESFISEVISNPIPGVDKALVIVGADLRGTIFGLYDVSEQIGVSPWWWFADVPVRKAAEVWALDTKKVQGSPSVKYRGIFINDEQPGLTNWINVNYAPGKYGPGFNHYFYANVFELLLRLRANYLWPAEWASMFDVDDVENQPLADAYGVVMGTSHTEPMMRASNEWGTFGSEYGGNGQWEYDTNNASLIPFFRYGAQRAKPYAANSLFTMAMRGSGDTAITLTVPEAITVLNNVVTEQRLILEDVFNGTNITDVPQMWCLYKEVQGYYETGMSVPDDVTLLWADDNWGNTRRLPLANETSRSGGAGVYYHFDYVGNPRDYKWINTIQLEKTVEQMQLSYARQADRIWIVNVGDLKPLEIPINHFMDMAYNTPQWGYDSVPTWLNLWAAREFGPEVSDDLSSVVDRYGMYAARRKYELIDPTIYSVINYNEADAVLTQWATLAADAQAIYDKLDASAQPAFYEMVLQPVLGGQVVNQIYIAAAKNLHNSVQKRNSANTIAQNVLELFNEDHVLTQRYHDLLGGKWNHMLDQTHLGYEINYWQQPMRNILPPLSYVQTLETSLAGNIGVGIEASNATVSGDDSYHANSGDTMVLPPMDPYGPKTRWIDIFARGTAGCEWSLNSTAPYVITTPSSGTTGGSGLDTRVYVSIDWSKAPPAPNSTTINIHIISSCANNTWGNYPAPIVQVPVNHVTIPSSFTGFVESDRHLAIEAEHTTDTNEVDGVSYIVLPGHGRTLSGVTMVPVLADTQPAGTGPVLKYDVFTFTNTSDANVTLYLSPSLNQNGGGFGQYRPLKYAIAFDDETPQTIQFVANVTSELNLPNGWNGAVSDGVWGVSSGNSTTTTHNLEVTGAHTLKIWAIEPGVIFQKIVVDLGGVRQSYLGPPESFRAGDDQVGTYDGTNALGVQVSSAI